MSGLSQRERELKLASADLFDDAVGKYELATEVVGLQKSQAHRCCSPNDDSSFFNLRHIAALERRAARPLVTIALARQAGGVFIRLPEDFGDASGLPMQVIALVKEVGDVADALRVGLADDDRLDTVELAKIERELDELIDKAAQGRAQVRAMQGKPAAPVRMAAVREASR
ncbi:MAG: phage regulatory CII family protein [Qipengyuania sp.]